jgi:hypothetical protein
MSSPGPAASQQAVVEAALVLLERMGLSPADLVSAPANRLAGCVNLIWPTFYFDLAPLRVPGLIRGGAGSTLIWPHRESQVRAAGRCRW